MHLSPGRTHESVIDDRRCDAMMCAVIYADGKCGACVVDVGVRTNVFVYIYTRVCGSLVGINS